MDPERGPAELKRSIQWCVCYHHTDGHGRPQKRFGLDQSRVRHGTCFPKAMLMCVASWMKGVAAHVIHQSGQAIEKLKWIGHWPPRRPRTSLRWIQKISKTVGLHAMPSSLTTRTGLNFAMQPWNPLNCQNGTCRFLVVVRSDQTGRLVKDLGQGADVERSCSPNISMKRGST